ncbi:MAG: hotdog fold thioesterase [Clostridia bacterium]|jgi:acyl-CoA thioesterase|nr:hotdog fold thioesterase [Clostridia bacterium]
MEKIKEFISQQDRFARLVGIELLEVKEGYAKAKLAVNEHHLNGVDIVHGGATFALADLVFAAASNSYGTVAVGINVSITYLKSTGQGSTIYAEAKEVGLNSKLATYLVNVTDENDELLAVFQGTVYRKKEQLLPE